jgi:hypothetical protein
MLWSIRRRTLMPQTWLVSRGGSFGGGVFRFALRAEYAFEAFDLFGHVGGNSGRLLSCSLQHSALEPQLAYLVLKSSDVVIDNAGVPKLVIGRFSFTSLARKSMSKSVATTGHENSLPETVASLMVAVVAFYWSPWSVGSHMARRTTFRGTTFYMYNRGFNPNSCKVGKPIASTRGPPMMAPISLSCVVPKSSFWWVIVTQSYWVSLDSCSQIPLDSCLPDACLRSDLLRVYFC